VRLTVPALALAAAASVALLGACGSKEKLSSEQADQFNARASQFSAAMTKLNTRATACSKKAASGDVDAVANCFARIFDDVSRNFEEISTYVAGLSRDVEGECSKRLTRVSGTLGEVSDQFSTAARDFRAGDLENLQQKLGDRRLDEIGPALRAAERACR